MWASPPLLTSGCHHWKPVQTGSFKDIPLLVLTPSGSYRNTYVWEAGSMHPTEMFSCCNCDVVKFLIETSSAEELTSSVTLRWIHIGRVSQGNNSLMRF